MLAWSHNSLIRKLLLVTVLSAYLVLYAVNIHKLSCTCPFLQCRSRSHCLKAAGFSCGTDCWGDRAGKGRLVLQTLPWEMCDHGFFLLAVVILTLLLFANVLHTLFIHYFAVLCLNYFLCVVFDIHCMTVLYSVVPQTFLPSSQCCFLLTSWWLAYSPGASGVILCLYFQGVCCHPMCLLLFYSRAIGNQLPVG